MSRLSDSDEEDQRPSFGGGGGGAPSRPQFTLKKTMETLSDSDEDQRPSFGGGAPSMQQAKPHGGGGAYKGGGGAHKVPLKPLKKRPYTETASHGDAPAVGLGSRPDEFIKMKREADAPEMSEMAKKMMAKMGHKAGTGLGKHGQGRTEIVEASMQRGRRGLGMVVRGFEPSEAVDWDFTKEEIVEEEVIDWVPEYKGKVMTLEEMQAWMEMGPKKHKIEDETNFCSGETLQMMLNGKSVFDRLEPEEMRRARTRSNPYETIRGAFFLNRAAMKMANMDEILNFIFTNPRKPNGESLVDPDELLYFADVCAGPGGFSEYVLWRKKGESKGFGLTLRGSNDFKLEDFYAGPPEMFEPHYGVKGLEGDGDVFNPDNQAAFIQFVMDNTHNQGVHLVMADGGFSVEGQENLQEILSKQLYLCQCLVAISILRTGGNFVCKLFDMFTPFSVGLVYLMNMAFDRVALIKPVTSRPANSERYIVCQGLRASSGPVRQYMHEVNLHLCKTMSSVSTSCLNHIVPLSTLTQDEPFFMYMVNSNENFAKVQAIHLKKIEIFTKNGQLHETRQSETRRKCLEKWKIPDEVRAAPGRPDPGAMFTTLVPEGSPPDVLESGGTELLPERLGVIKAVSSYTCSVRGEGPCFYIIGCGRFHVYKWEPKAAKWVKFEFKVELPSKTLLEVQAVTELRGEGKGQRRTTIIHVLDALFLCGEDIRHMAYEKRQQRLGKFVTALRKPTRSDLAMMHKPDVWPLDQMGAVMDRLSMRQVKGASNPRLCFCNSAGNFFQPSGVSIVQTVKEPWIVSRSKSTGLQYWYNVRSKQSVYECPDGATASLSDCKKSALVWSWKDGVKVHAHQDSSNPKLVSKDQMMAYIGKLKGQ